VTKSNLESIDSGLFFGFNTIKNNANKSISIETEMLPTYNLFVSGKIKKRYVIKLLIFTVDI